MGSSFRGPLQSTAMSRTVQWLRVLHEHAVSTRQPLVPVRTILVQGRLWRPSLIHDVIFVSTSPVNTLRPCVALTRVDGLNVVITDGEPVMMATCSCPASCHSCDADATCTKCKGGAYLLHGECHSTCPESVRSHVVVRLVLPSLF